jgi:hypothetical protein
VSETGFQRFPPTPKISPFDNGFSGSGLGVVLGVGLGFGCNGVLSDPQETSRLTAITLK